MSAVMPTESEIGTSTGSGSDECVSAADFPAWLYAEITVGNEYRVVSIFHVTTPAGVVPYWYEDSENQHRGLPLLRSLRPTLLGDYGSYLQEGENLQWFVAICKVKDDLPDPLLAVQVIRWLDRRKISIASDLAKNSVATAMKAVQEGVKRRRKEFDQVMSIITGMSQKP